MPPITEKTANMGRKANFSDKKKGSIIQTRLKNQKDLKKVG